MPEKKRDLELGTNYFPVILGISVERKLGSHQTSKEETFSPES